MFRVFPAAVCLVVLGVSAAGATTYPPVSFGQLVEKAEAIFVGEVVDLRSFWTGSADRRVIRTRVVFAVAERLSGGGGATEIIEVLGGQIDGTRMEVAGGPTFTRGDRHVVFAYRRPMAIPIVGVTQGLLRLKRDATGADRVLTYEGVVLGGVDNSGALSVRRTASASAMTLASLRDRVRVVLTGRRDR